MKSLFTIAVTRRIIPLVPRQEIFHRENDDPRIRITTGFANVGKPIEPGEIGFGCAYACAYCNQQVMDKNIQGQSNAGAIYPAIDGGVSINPDLYFNKHLIQQYDVNEIINELKQYPYWQPNAPVIVSNFSDPSLNWGKAINLSMRLVNELGQQGPIQFITKGAISEKHVREFRELQRQGGHPIVIVTYSGMPTSIEPIPAKTRTDTISKLRSAGIPVIMSMRPMVMGVNGELTKIEQVLRQVGEIPSIITVGGLYVYSGLTTEAFKKAGFELGEPYASWKYPIRKILPEGYRDQVRTLAQSMGNVAPIYNHTSCAASSIMTTEYNHSTPDSFAHWAGDTQPAFEYCNTYCNQEQIPICEQNNIRDPQKIKIAETMLQNMDYEGLTVKYSQRLSGTLLVEGGSLPVGELYPIVRATGLKVFNLPTEQGLRYRTTQAIELDLGSPSCQITHTFQIGEEWFVLLTHYPQNDQKLTTLYVRSRNQSRVTPYALEDLNNPEKRRTISQHMLSVAGENVDLSAIQDFLNPKNC
jgi:DNA repair photolyase